MGKSDSGNHGNISKFKRGLLNDPGKDFDGGFNTKSGIRSASKGRVEGKFQGKECGDTKHTYKGE